MNEYTPGATPEESIEETRRKKLEEFKSSYDPGAIRGDYDVDVPELYSDSSAEPESKPRRVRNDEINSFSDSDTKRRIERDSRKALQQQKREEKRIEKSKAKRNRRVFKWVWLSMVVIVAVVLSQFVLLGVNDMLAVTRGDNVHTVTVSVPADPTIDMIADILVENGVIAKPQFFMIYTRLTSSESGFRQGEFKLDTNKDYEAIINTLQSNTSRTDIVTVQITEGMNVQEIAALLHKEGVVTDIQAFLDVCNSDEFDEDYPFLTKFTNTDSRYYKLEGYLFPDTYDFYIGEDPKLTVSKLLDNYLTKMISHKEKYFGHTKRMTLEQEAEATGYTADEILTIASIIQAEAADKEDMYYISSILHNRLKYGASEGVAKLNCDCTVYYPYRELEDVPERRKDYQPPGLPPGPICNPGIEAIKAAVNPYDTNYLFFCHDTPENGSTAYYSTTLDEHNYYLSVIG